MSDKNNILIKDFTLFTEVVKSAAKIMESAKFIINENGLQIYGARKTIARCELISNSIFSEKEITFCILKLNTFLRVLQSVEQIHDNDFSDLEFILDLPFIKIKSKKFKTKYNTCNEDIISKWISKKIETKLSPVFEFITTSDMIKNVNNHTFIFSDTADLRVILDTLDDMEHNSIFATIKNSESNNLSNDITLKCGLVTNGKLDNRKIILDFERLNLFNSIISNNIKISLMDMNVLVGYTSLTGKNDSYFNLTIYSTLIKS